MEFSSNLLLENIEQNSLGYIFFQELFSSSMQFRVFDTTYKKCIRKIKDYKNKNNLTGKIGEICVYDFLIYLLWQKGYKYSCNTNVLMSYRLISQYRKNPRRRYGGIDYYLTITTADGVKHRAMIELSNWMKMHNINDYIWNTRILNKFKTHDRLNRCMHIVMMNHRNIHLLQERANTENVLLIPLPEHLTYPFLLHLRNYDKLIPLENYQKLPYLLNDMKQ